MSIPTVVSVFCGCGGFDLGFTQAGFEVIYACDNDSAAVACYARNVEDRVHCHDVTSDEFHRDVRNVGRCDLVLGGFPCQGFSKAGPKQEDDSRNTLYTEMQRVVAQLSPALFIAENVDGMSQNFGGSYLKRVVSDFASIGYRVEHRVIDAAAFGVPQHRRRVFFVGTKAGGRLTFTWPEPTHRCASRNGEFRIGEPTGPTLFDPSPDTLKPTRTMRDAIADLINQGPEVADHTVEGGWPAKYTHIFRRIGPGQKLCNVRHAETSVYTWQIPEVFGETTDTERKVLEAISTNRRRKRYGNTPNGNPLPVDEIGRLSGLEDVGAVIASLLKKDYLKEIDGKYDLKGAMFCSGIFKRPLWDEPSPTVLTNFNNPRYFLHPSLDRPFTLRECARLQSFPDDFYFLDDRGAVDIISGYRLVGNAVPPVVSRAFADAVLASLPANRRTRQAAT